MSEAKVINIEAGLPHHVAEVICVKCAHRYMAVWPVGTPVKDLECAGCHETGGIITTGDPAMRADNES